MDSGFVGLESLLQVSRQVRVEMRERLRPRMAHMRDFHATCHNTEDVYEALRRAQSLFDGERPFSRTLHVTFTTEETGS
jgi:hypothetical protein